MNLTTDLVQKYIQDNLDKQQMAEFEQLFAGSEANSLLANILQACKQHYPSFNESENHTLSFEQIDDLILRSLADNLSSENLNQLIAAINQQPDFIEKLQTRMRSNVTAEVESEQLSLAGIEMLTDESLLQKMNIKTAPQNTAGVQQDNFLQKLIGTMGDFVRSLAIPKPAYYLVPIALTALFITLFLPEPDMIDAYTLDNWQAYEVDVTTLRSTDSDLDANMLALMSYYKMALANYINEDYQAAMTIFADVLADIQTRDDIQDDLRFDINFMAGMASLSHAMTDETTFNDEVIRIEYFNTAVKHFTEAKKYAAAASPDDKNALHYYMGLTLIFLDRKEDALRYLSYVKEGDFINTSKDLLNKLK